jgi:hypothetical protein
MAKTRYATKKVSAARMEVMERATAIVEEYAAQGIRLTLRALYYRHVARGLIPNNQSEYNRLGDAVNDARMLGIMDWDHLTDQTRGLADWRYERAPEAALRRLAEQYHKDLWATQDHRVEVWVEKDAAVGVVEGVCRANGVPYFSARGYASSTSLHDAAQRIRWHIEEGKAVTILHIGDHDPSGLDMTRDIEDRLRTFLSVDWAGLHMGPGQHTRGSIRSSMLSHLAQKQAEAGGYGVRGVLDELEHDGVLPWRVKRIALNIDQIETYAPPPQFAKQTDARYARYVEETGLDESWELDALEPTVTQALIDGEVDALRDEARWAEAESALAHEKAVLTGASNYWPDIEALVTKKKQGES